MGELLGLIGGLKNGLIALVALAGSAWVWWLNRSRKQYKDETEKWRAVGQILKEDKSTNAKSEVDKQEVADLPDTPTDLELMADKLRERAEAHNRDT